ncbi:hypothetical protein ACFL7M_10080 [Thermodesulfobacteriota bacterium]
MINTPQGGATEGNAALRFTQGHESLVVARDRELVERPVEWQMTL